MANTSLDGQALQYIGTNSFSGASSVEFTDLSSGYIAYVFYFSKVSVSNSTTEVYCRTSTNNGSSYDAGATDYRYSNLQRNSGAFGDLESTGAAQVPVSVSITNTTADYNGSFSVLLTNPAGSQYQSIISLGSGLQVSAGLAARVVMGERVSTTAVNAVQFLPDAGTFTGTVNVYGYKNA